MKRKSLGETPWDAVVPPKDSGPAPEKTRKSTPEPTRAPLRDAGGHKERLTVHVTVAVAERAKNAVYWTPGLTLASLTENALVKALESIEKAQGGPFPHRKSELKGGRPMK